MNKYILYVLIFLILGEIIHQIIKGNINLSSILDNNINKNKDNNIYTESEANKEQFTNYNELPHLSNLNKSYPRDINTNSYTPDTGIQPIVIETKLPVLSNGELPTLGYYYDNNYANSMITSIIRKYILPANITLYKESNTIYTDLVKTKKLNLGIIRDYEVINNITNNSNTGTDLINVICPLIYETVFMITTNKIPITHFQLVNNINIKTPIKLFTTPNDKPLLDIILNIFKIDTRRLEVNVIQSMTKCISEFMLEDESILFICCHFKNKYLRALFENKQCVLLDYIPTIKTLRAIGNYSKNKPINNDALEKLNNKLLTDFYKELNISGLYYYNLSKNKVVSLVNSSIYKTVNIRNSLYINKELFTSYQLELLANNIIRYYQTLEQSLNNWNTIPEYDNNDTKSLDFLQLSNVNPRIEIEENIKQNLIENNLIKVDSQYV